MKYRIFNSLQAAQGAEQVANRWKAAGLQQLLPIITKEGSTRAAIAIPPHMERYLPDGWLNPTVSELPPDLAPDPAPPFQ